MLPPLPLLPSLYSRKTYNTKGVCASTSLRVKKLTVMFMTLRFDDFTLTQCKNYGKYRNTLIISAWLLIKNCAIFA